ncbi:TetR/AcrR family transcriptional regulator [Nocardioides daeguensis]|uniref:TetR/AcrR family transcriptional regulator n=1 Tax=Nocardioides daeguensis TaxID=908359 RepID=A0ABP6WK22_9ACTN|nr:TetR/AcrR family transcriptional regulator [Nocardioides daeguensis]MBV6729092.1 TetR/AcrR family transcriptional regulator [Nocardioides daeguensis]MCR1774904.1 TetR/AcrR family transcriptional regulator [Nocardioides daeguensis]
MSPKPSTPEAPTRPRVEGDREQEILDATLGVLIDVGYDRLTMDAVATKAKASKATLYRKWDGKAALVIDALMSQKTPLEVPQDTGSLRGDLLAVFCAPGGLTDEHQTAILGSVITAIGRDAEFAAAFRDRFIAPKVAVARQIYERAHERGELREDLDLEILSAALPGIVLHRMFLLGDLPNTDLIARVVDQVIIPAATRG